MGATQSVPVAPLSPQQMAPSMVAMSPESNMRLRREFDRLFVDMEFRCKRAAMMNYYEAEKYDNRAHSLQMVSGIVGGLGVSGIAASIAKTKRIAANSTGLVGLLAIPLSASLEFFSNGSTTLVPTVAEKAKLHVRAGAGWQRIARLTHAYRLQLKHMPEGSLNAALLSTWYREVVEASEEVSQILPIRAETYQMFEHPEFVKERSGRRENMLLQYLEQDVVVAP